jgi:uncharacterized protein YjbJ (UPF0337 family)
MNRDTTEGKFDQLKGRVKQSVGEAIGNDKLANSGTADQVKGNVREAWGNAKDAAGAASVDAGTRADAHKHDVRAKITSTAQNVKDSVNAKAEDIKLQHKRTA